MDINKAIFLFLLIISTTSFSQNKTNDDITDITKATFFSPGISYEKRIGKFQSLFGSVSVNPSFSIGYSSALGDISSVTFDPGLSIEYRYYYNYDKRLRKGKRTELNSLNYISPTFGTIFSKNRISTSYYIENNRRAINTVGLVWGIQRNYKKRFSLDLRLGAGYLFTTATLPDNTGQTIKEKVGQFSILTGLNLGFWLNKRG